MDVGWSEHSGGLTRTALATDAREEAGMHEPGPDVNATGLMMNCWLEAWILHLDTMVSGWLPRLCFELVPAIALSDPLNVDLSSESGDIGTTQTILSGWSGGASCRNSCSCLHSIHEASKSAQMR